MQEFLEPTEESVTLPLVQSREALGGAETSLLIRQIEEATKTAANLYAGSQWIGLVTTGAIFLSGALFGMFRFTADATFLQIALRIALIGMGYVSLPFIGKRTLARTEGVRRLQRSVSEILAGALQNPQPALAPALLRLSLALFRLEREGVKMESANRLNGVIDNLLLNMTEEGAKLFETGDIQILHAVFIPNAVLQNIAGKRSQIAVANALKYVGDEASARVLKGLLRKRPPARDSYQTLLYETIEASLPVIEARLANAETSRNLLRPSQLIDESTLLRPSQESSEPVEELLRPSQGEK